MLLQTTCGLDSSSWLLSSPVAYDDDGDGVVSAGCLSVCHQTFGLFQELTVPDALSAAAPLTPISGKIFLQGYACFRNLFAVRLRRC